MSPSPQYQLQINIIRKGLTPTPKFGIFSLKKHQKPTGKQYLITANGKHYPHFTGVLIVILLWRRKHALNAKRVPVWSISIYKPLAAWAQEGHQAEELHVQISLHGQEQWWAADCQPSSVFSHKTRTANPQCLNPATTGPTITTPEQWTLSYRASIASQPF